MELLVVLVLFVLMMVGLTRPFIGLLALLIVMEMQPGELYPALAPLHLERIAAFLLLVSFVMHGQKLRFPIPMRWFLAFFAAMVLSIPLAFWRGNAANSCISFLEVVVYVLFAAALITTENRMRWFIFTGVLLVDWMGGMALWNYMHGEFQVRMEIDRAIGITSSAGDPDTLAATLLFSIPLCLALMARSNPRWMRLVGLASVGVHVLTILDTGSRAIAAGVCFLVLLLLFRKPKNLLFIPVLVVLCPLIWMVIPPQYKARYQTMAHLSDDASYQNRLLSWQGGIKMFEHNPITGIGAGDYTDANGAKYWPGLGQKHYLNAHSLYFKLLGELGLVGIVTFGGFLFCLFRMNLRMRKELRARNASSFLQILPDMFMVILLLLLFDGYAAHNLYRHNWFIVGAMTAALSLLPIMTRQPVEVPAGESLSNFRREPDGDWSPALLPALRNEAGDPRLV
jgi:O-antigen ligase